MLKLIAASFSKFDHLLRTGNPNFQICDALQNKQDGWLVGWLVGWLIGWFKKVSVRKPSKRSVFTKNPVFFEGYSRRGYLEDHRN